MLHETKSNMTKRGILIYTFPKNIQNHIIPACSNLAALSLRSQSKHKRKFHINLASSHQWSKLRCRQTSICPAYASPLPGSAHLQRQFKVQVMFGSVHIKNDQALFDFFLCAANLHITHSLLKVFTDNFCSCITVNIHLSFNFFFALVHHHDTAIYLWHEDKSLYYMHSL